MKDYSKMSDFEINKAVALILGIEVVEWGGKIFGCLLYTSPSPRD